jgi:hypothetical protein
LYFIAYGYVIHFSQCGVGQPDVQFGVIHSEAEIITQSHITLQMFKFCPSFFGLHGTHNTTLISLFFATVHYVVLPAGLVGWWKEKGLVWCGLRSRFC